MRPTKRRGNRRYYQLHEVQLIRKIRELLYDQGFTIVGARNKLQGVANEAVHETPGLYPPQMETQSLEKAERNAVSNLVSQEKGNNPVGHSATYPHRSDSAVARPLLHQLRKELLDIRDLL